MWIALSLRRSPSKADRLVECEPIGLMEQTESSWERPGEQEEDHTILATLIGETAVIDETFQASMREFVLHIFDHIPGKKTDCRGLFGKRSGGSIY